MRRERNPWTNADKKRIAYLVGSFPSLTKTFINREILEAKRQGINLVLIAIRRPGAFVMGGEVRQLAAETRYILPVGWFRFLADHLRFGLTRPRVYLATLIYLLTRRHDTLATRIKTFLHFGEGVVAAGLLQPERIHHIHAHFADRAATVALVASRLLGVPYSLTAHANDIYVAPVLLPEKIAHAKFVTTCTTYNQAHLEQLTQRRIELVYHGLDLAALTPAPRPTRVDPWPLVLSVGQLKEKKGFKHLTRACGLLKSRGVEFRCEIIGEGPQRGELEQLVADCGLQDTVALRGALPNAEVMAQYGRATLFVLPCVVAGNADRDGIPNVLLEAMASRVSVITTRLSGIPELVEDGVTGLLVDPGDETALAEAIVRLLNDAELRGRLARQGRRRVEERFDIRVNTGRLVELLEAAPGQPNVRD